MDSIRNKILTCIVSLAGTIIQFMVFYIIFILLNWMGINLNWNYLIEGILFINIFKNGYRFLINK